MLLLLLLLGFTLLCSVVVTGLATISLAHTPFGRRAFAPGRLAVH